MYTYAYDDLLVIEFARCTLQCAAQLPTTLAEPSLHGRSYVWRSNDSLSAMPYHQLREAVLIVLAG